MIRPTNISQSYTEKIGTLEIKPEYAIKSLYDIAEENDMAFGVLKVQTEYTSPVSGQKFPSKSYSVIRADNDFELGNGFTEDYQPLSYVDMLEVFFEDIKNISGIPTRAIKFGIGEKGAFQFIFPKDWQVAGTTHKTFWNLYSSHNGTVATTINVSDVTIICGNTFNFSLMDKSLHYSVRHTTNSQERLVEIRKLFNISEANMGQYYNQLDKMALMNAKGNVISDFLEYMIPTKKENGQSMNSGPKSRQLDLTQAIIHSAENERNKSDVSIYDLFQGTTRYSNHRTGKRSESEQFEFVMEGEGAKFNNKAFNWLQNYVDSQ